MSEPDLLHDGEPRVVIRDKRRLDPTSGEVRPTAAQPDSTGPATSEEAPVDDRSAELLADLQRVKAEFDNYRKRVERDRVAVVEQAAARVVAELVPVLDDIELARRHGEVEGGFKSVADALDVTLSRIGLERFGVVGDPFDPTRHEAVLHTPSADVDAPTCVEIMRAGYTFSGRLLRPAIVAVADSADAEPPGPATGE